MIITMEPVKVPIYQGYCVLTMVKEHCLRLSLTCGSYDYDITVHSLY